MMTDQFEWLLKADLNIHCTHICFGQCKSNVCFSFVSLGKDGKRL